MGFMKDLRDLNKLGKEASKDHDPAAQMRAATAQMNQMAAQSRLAHSGAEATATVVALRDTGTQVNLQPVTEVDLTVVPLGALPFAATAPVFGQAQLAGLVPGGTVRVRYDPAEPGTIVII